MTKAYYLYAPVLLACATAAGAAETKFSLSAGYTDYSKAFGTRRETTAESTTDLGRTAFTVSLSHGQRKFEKDSASALRVSGTIFHDWNSRIYTRTNLAVSSDKPVYATREIANDVNFKLLPTVVATVGGKYARYHDNRDVKSLSAGGTWYFAAGFVTYRYSAFDVERLGNGHGHMATVRIKDGNGDGATQLWLGSGTSLHEQEVLLSGRRGDYRSVALQRVQPIRGKVSATVTLGRAWYDTQTENYRGTTASLGLRVNGWPKL